MLGLHQAGIPHKYPAKAKPEAGAKAEPDTTSAAGKADKAGADVASAGGDASKSTAAPAPGVSTGAVCLSIWSKTTPGCAAGRRPRMLQQNYNFRGAAAQFCG